MQKWILAVSPDIEILEQISAHLQEGGRFLVICVTNGKEALAAATSQSFDLAILDAEINDLPFVPLTRELTALIPSLKIFVYPPHNNSKHPVLNGLVANGFLNKPFFGPEVSEKIIHLFKECVAAPSAIQRIEETLPQLWVEHPDTGAKQIEQILGATSASAGLLLMRGQVIAGTGALADETATNIINFLTRYWTNIQSGELFRYLKMNHETTTFLVYAAPLFKNVAIALVYHPNTALLDIRNEVLRLRKAFLGRYMNTGELRHDFSVIDPLQPLSTETPAMPYSEQRVKTHPLQAEAQENPVIEPEEEFEPELNEKDLKNLDALLADMPEPDPNGITLTTSPLVEIPPADEPVALNGQKEQNLGSELNEFEQKEALEKEPELGVPDQQIEMEQPEEPEPSSNGKTAPLPRLPEQPSSVPVQQFPDFDFKLPWEEPTVQAPGVEAPVAEAPEEQTAPVAVPPPLPFSEQPVKQPSQEAEKPVEEASVQVPDVEAPVAEAPEEQTAPVVFPPPLPYSEEPVEQSSQEAEKPVEESLPDFAQPMDLSSQEVEQSSEEPVEQSSQEAEKPVEESLPDFAQPVDLSPQEVEQSSEEPSEEATHSIDLPPGFESYVPLDEDLESIKPSELLFCYNFILVPRNPGQFITHDLAELLNQTLPQFHSANGWEFLGISTRPLYLQWSAAVPLSVCLKEMVSEIRQLVNNRIFITYPDLLNAHSSADFWANGFFAISGAHSPSTRLINDYISLSRQVLPPAMPF